MLLLIVLIFSMLPYPIQAIPEDTIVENETLFDIESEVTTDSVYEIEDDTEIIEDIEINELNICSDVELSAVIPDNSESILNDLGLFNGIVADIKPIQTFSLRGHFNDIVSLELEVSQYDDGDSVDVIHFIENSAYISDDSIILNISEFSRQSKNI